MSIFNMSGWLVAAILALVLCAETVVLSYVVGWAMSGFIGALFRRIAKDRST